MKKLVAAAVLLVAIVAYMPAQPVPVAFAQASPSPVASPAASPSPVAGPTPRAGGFPFELATPLAAGGAAALLGGGLMLWRGCGRR
ncbi:MAG: hypothetical protein U0821_11345 [Chloroflexota bacterium]